MSCAGAVPAGCRLLVATVLLVSAPTGMASDAVLVDELEPLYADSTVVELLAEGTVDRGGLALHVPRQVPAGVHVLITGLTAGEGVTVNVMRDGRSQRDTRVFRLLDVPVEENTGLSGRTAAFDPSANPHVIRRAPFRVFEVLSPLGYVGAEGVHLAAARTLALRVEVPLGPGSSVGVRELSVVVETAARRHVLPWRLAVHEAVVPPPGKDTLQYTNWLSPEQIARAAGVEPWTEGFWKELPRWAVMLRRGRQNTVWVRWRDIFAAPVDPGGPPRLRRARLLRWVTTFEAAGLWYLEGAPFAVRPDGDWSSPNLHLRLTGERATEGLGREQVLAMSRQLMQMIEEQDWGDRWLQHLADEPTDVNAADYRRLADMLREVMPGIPTVEATMSRALAGAVDVWCPQVHRFQQHRAFFEERRAAGDRLWVYTCLVPGGPWVNRLLDQERLRPVVVGWAAAAWDLDGFLHWGLNHWKADPYMRSVVDHPAQPGTTNRLPAGDTHVLYPGIDGPWSGQRFEAHRIGLEDHELLMQLAARDAARADEITAEVFRAFDDFVREVPAYRVARGHLLEALDRP